MTYSVQYSDTHPDLPIECGPVAKHKTIAVLKDFPFAEEFAKTEAPEGGCLPTIVFSDIRTKSEFAVWMEESNVLTLEISIGCHSLAITRPFSSLDSVITALGLFFDGNWVDICRLFDHHEPIFQLPPKVPAALFFECIAIFSGVPVVLLLRTLFPTLGPQIAKLGFVLCTFIVGNVFFSAFMAVTISWDRFKARRLTILKRKESSK